MAPVNKGNQEAKKKRMMTKQDLPVRSNCLKADQEEKKKEDDDEQDLGWSQGLIV